MRNNVTMNDYEELEDQHKDLVLMMAEDLFEMEVAEALRSERGCYVGSKWMSPKNTISQLIRNLSGIW